MKGDLKMAISEEMQESILGALENVIDPELGIDIVNLGLVYKVDLDEEGTCTVTMTLTSMGCPLGPVIVDQVNTALSELPEIKKVDVNIVWQPVWNKDMMSRYAKMALGIR
ncbi:Metal-sulfur cluster biosynthetic enzyme OS=Ureibacillus acetophenoni OX=614649 GN=SAMN05877842_101236 PE=4 SV=1 [Ureibacillus acetophenoni]